MTLQPAHPRPAAQKSHRQVPCEFGHTDQFNFRAFAIVPAAGLSVRMGQSKLLLPLEGRPLIAHAIAAWEDAGVDAIAVVVRADDHNLAAAVEDLGNSKVELVRPAAPPPDMKASVQAAVLHLQARWSPTTEDCFLVAPADMPRLSPIVIAQMLIESIYHADKMIVPTAFGRRGHPVLFPWTMADAVLELPTDAGLNVLVERGPAVAMPSEILLNKNLQGFDDVDTPEEFRRLTGE
jgi:molybdenum cofactor cytidylyltransferase